MAEDTKTADAPVLYDVDSGEDARAVIGDVMQLSDGQVALSARNEGDGTWSVRAGPGGPVLYEGLPMEKALAIVGAPTGPHVPLNKQEAENAEMREDAEEALREFANKDALASDEELGLTDARGRPVFKDEPDPVRLKPAAGARKGARASAMKNGRTGNGGGTKRGGDA